MYRDAPRESGSFRRMYLYSYSTDTQSDQTSTNHYQAKQLSKGVRACVHGTPHTCARHGVIVAAARREHQKDAHDGFHGLGMATAK